MGQWEVWRGHPRPLLSLFCQQRSILFAKGGISEQAALGTFLRPPSFYLNFFFSKCLSRWKLSTSLFPLSNSTTITTTTDITVVCLRPLHIQEKCLRADRREYYSVVKLALLFHVIFHFHTSTFIYLSRKLRSHAHKRPVHRSCRQHIHRTRCLRIEYGGSARRRMVGKRMLCGWGKSRLYAEKTRVSRAEILDTIQMVLK